MPLYRSIIMKILSKDSFTKNLFFISVELYPQLLCFCLRFTSNFLCFPNFSTISLTFSSSWEAGAYSAGGSRFPCKMNIVIIITIQKTTFWCLQAFLLKNSKYGWIFFEYSTLHNNVTTAFFALEPPFLGFFKINETGIIYMLKTFHSRIIRKNQSSSEECQKAQK